MSEHPVPPLDDDVLALLRLERAPEAVPAELRARLAQRVAQTVGVPIPPGEGGGGNEGGGSPPSDTGSVPGPAGSGAASTGASAASATGLGLKAGTLLWTVATFGLGAGAGAVGHAMLAEEPRAATTAADATAESSGAEGPTTPVEQDAPPPPPPAPSPVSSGRDQTVATTHPASREHPQDQEAPRGRNQPSSSPSVEREDTVDEETSVEPTVPTGAASGAPGSAAIVAVDQGGSGNLAQERQWVDRARAALARGRPADALEALAVHRSSYPRGSLREERDALSVRALVAIGRSDDAARARTEFLERYPRSIFRALVE